MMRELKWSAAAPPGLDVASLNIEDANVMAEAAGHEPLDRGTLNAMHRAGWHTVEPVIYGERKALLIKASIGDKRLDQIDRWRSALLKLIEPDGETMSTAERVVVNLIRRKEPEAQVADTAELLTAIREMQGTEHLRELLVELALLVPPGRCYSGELRDWLLEVARG